MIRFGQTQEEKAYMREIVQTWKPWLKSTGPKTKAGKKKVAMNSFKGGIRPLQEGISRNLKAQKRFLKSLDIDALASGKLL